MGRPEAGDCLFLFRPLSFNLDEAIAQTPPKPPRSVRHEHSVDCGGLGTTRRKCIAAQVVIQGSSLDLT